MTENIAERLKDCLSKNEAVPNNLITDAANKIEEQRKHLLRLEERNQELSKVLGNVLKDIVFYQNYSGAEMYRTDFKTAAEMRQAMYHWQDIAQGKKDK
jgi:N-acetylglucosamine kinase-like BadF-type ATPase